MRGWMAVLAALAIAEDAGAQKPDAFCSDLSRVIEAAGEDDPFARLERSAAALPNFGFGEPCQRSGDERHYFWLCTLSLAPASLNASGLANQVRACLPEAETLTLSQDGPRNWSFVGSEATIRIAEHGTERSHVGRTVTLVVEAPPRAAEK